MDTKIVVGDKSLELLGVLLTVLFAAFKLLGVISWSWWWVFSPIWIPVAFGIAILCVVGIIFLLTSLFIKE